MITNKQIEIFSEGKDWEGNVNRVSEGFFDVYLEEDQTNRNLTFYEGRQQVYDEGQLRKGFFIIFENINFKDKTIEYNEKTYAVQHVDRFFDEYGDFHHAEVDFK